MRNRLRFFTLVCLAAVCGCTEREPAASQEGIGAEGSARAQPNILFIVADDLGYTDIGAFGGEIPTPTLDELAFQGLRLTNLHTAQACQQTRAMLMSSNGLAAALESRPPRPDGGRDNRLRLDRAIIPELLRDAGYRTYMVGKWDLGLSGEYTPARRGFDRSFVMLDASASHFAEPFIYDGSYYEEDGRPVELDELPEDFYTTRVYTDKMLGYLRGQEGDSPWFAYLAYTAPHWPLQVPADWLDRHAGRYDAGYDVLRAARVARAMELGVLPSNANLEAFAPVQKPWTELGPEEQRRHARAEEIYAAMVEYLDFSVGRLVEYLQDSGQLDNTVIMFMSDHGASPAAYGLTVGPQSRTGGGPRIPDFINNDFDNFGRRGSFIDHGMGFAEAATAPLKYFKGSISDGGTRAVSFVCYPAAVRQGVDGAFLTVMDILPTFLDIAGSKHPGAALYNGRQIVDIVGRSFWPLLTGEAQTVHPPSDAAGWIAGSTGALIKGDFKIINQPAPGIRVEGRGPWRLYDLVNDPGETRDLSAENPQLVRDLVAEWEQNWR